MISVQYYECYCTLLRGGGTFLGHSVLFLVYKHFKAHNFSCQIESEAPTVDSRAASSVFRQDEKVSVVGESN